MTLRLRFTAVVASVFGAAALMLIMPDPAQSQPLAYEATQLVEDVQAKPDKNIERVKQLEQIIGFLNKNLEAANTPVQQKYRDALIAQYDHSIAMMKYTQSLYEWELFASTVSLWLIVAIVASGVGFSGLQLWQAVVKGAPQAENQLEIAATKFRLTSSVVGIVVLGMSFFFFYLFVKEIYAIKPIASSQISNVSNAVDLR
jgi:hypothetical protein